MVDVERLQHVQAIAFTASETEDAERARVALIEIYGDSPLETADVIVALGGDGFMLQTLHASKTLETPVYGMNCGTIGFLMNDYSELNLRERLAKAVMEEINPLRMVAICDDGTVHEALAINEVALLRAGSQAAKLRIFVDGYARLEELVCDGALVATPAGSTAYNYSAHGPILPIGSQVLALTPISAFRPRRWRGALLSESAKVRFEVLDPQKRPVMADADGRSAGNVTSVEVTSAEDVTHRILFDLGHGLKERLLREQFI